MHFQNTKRSGDWVVDGDPNPSVVLLSGAKVQGKGEGEREFDQRLITFSTRTIDIEPESYEQVSLRNATSIDKINLSISKNVLSKGFVAFDSSLLLPSSHY